MSRRPADDRTDAAWEGWTEEEITEELRPPSTRPPCAFCDRPCGDVTPDALDEDGRLLHGACAAWLAAEKRIAQREATSTAYALVRITLLALGFGLMLSFASTLGEDGRAWGTVLALILLSAGWAVNNAHGRKTLARYERERERIWRRWQERRR